MKTIKLLNLKLVNFKGIKEFELDAAGEDIKVYGDNATGKTTLFDAFVWLLFNKDSLNKTDFVIKTLENGKPIHRLDHEVEARLSISDPSTQDEDKFKVITLKKVLKEKWTKPRGQLEHIFGGHTTDYYINGVPSIKKEFDAHIKSIVDEEVFKLLTNPSYFNEQLHWKDQRKTLLEIAGDVTDEDVIATNKDLEKLLDKLNGNNIEDHKKIIAAKRKEINQELERIPIRVDETHRNMPDTSVLNESDIKASLDNILNEIEIKYEQINSIKNGSEANELKKKISDIDLQIVNVRNEHTQNEQQELFKLKTRVQEEQSNLSILRGDVRNHEQRKAMNGKNIKDYEIQMDSLRDRYKELQQQYEEQASQEYDHENNCVCPTCEQDLPEDKVQEAIDNFNRNKAKLLENIKNQQEKINQEGVQLKEKVESIKEENDSLQKEIDKIVDQGKRKAKEIEMLEQKVKNAESNIKPIEENEKYIQLVDEKETIQDRIDDIAASMDESIQSVQKEIETLKDEQKELQIGLSKIQQVEQSKKRIAELEKQQKELATEYEDLEHQLYLTEEFTRTKVNLLTEKINSKFKYARFNLFEEQINGGLKDICEATFEGVPYGSGLNNAAKINVGLDIINTLSSHYGVQAPIFIDNAESVTKLIDIDSQIISLIVSENDKELRIESKSDDKSEVA